LKMNFVKDGEYTSTAQLASVKNWKDTIVANVNDFFKLKNKEQAGGAAIFTGYIHIEQAGSYTLHCLADEFYLGNKLLIENHKMKKNGTSDITVPLTAGYFSIKIAFLNRIYKGVVSQWVDARPTVRPEGNPNRDLPTPVYY
jgi:PA14 domain